MLSRVTAQISLYPLRQSRLGAVIDRAVAALRQRNLRVEPGPMSTLITGPADELFPALQAAFDEAAKDGDVVLVVTVSNACPEKVP
jgi:uncharacterized protein YqgV (UPF0045/DUF77 family)